MKATDLREMTVEDLARKAAEIRENLFNLKIRHAAGTLDSSADLGANKKDLARIMTVLTQKAAAAVKAAAPAQAAPAGAAEKKV